MADTFGRWDLTTNRPIVDGKTTNPDTGEAQPASETRFFGPPWIDMFWHNTAGEGGEDDQVFKGSRGPTGPNIDAVLVRVAKVVEDGWVKIQSLNCTEFSCTIVCESKMTNREFGHVVWGDERRE